MHVLIRFSIRTNSSFWGKEVHNQPSARRGARNPDPYVSVHWRLKSQGPVGWWHKPQRSKNQVLCGCWWWACQLRKRVHELALPSGSLLPTLLIVDLHSVHWIKSSALPETPSELMFHQPSGHTSAWWSWHIKLTVIAPKVFYPLSHCML